MGDVSNAAETMNHIRGAWNAEHGTDSFPDLDALSVAALRDVRKNRRPIRFEEANTLVMGGPNGELDSELDELWPALARLIDKLSR